MAKFIVMGSYTAKGLGGFVNNPTTRQKSSNDNSYVLQQGKTTGYC